MEVLRAIGAGDEQGLVHRNPAITNQPYLPTRVSPTACGEVLFFWKLPKTALVRPVRRKDL